MILDFPLPSFPATQESGCTLAQVSFRLIERRAAIQCEVGARPEVNEDAGDIRCEVGIAPVFSWSPLAARDIRSPGGRISRRITGYHLCESLS
jgi:hypothetical protein